MKLQLCGGISCRYSAILAIIAGASAGLRRDPLPVYGFHCTAGVGAPIESCSSAVCACAEVGIVACPSLLQVDTIIPTSIGSCPSCCCCCRVGLRPSLAEDKFTSAKKMRQSSRSGPIPGSSFFQTKLDQYGHDNSVRIFGLSITDPGQCSVASDDSDGRDQ
ncbi:hypothetical protein ZWY2020_006750 [Hordeum vulgare]|nr:hypothetical protein ZWY2020_006750 [Hordeum vulgare]